MSESRNNEEDSNNISDLSPWEQLLYKELQERDNSEAIYNAQVDATIHKLFGLFQGAAHCLAVLYKTASDSGRPQPGLWSAFQAAAGTITAHHKACVDYVRICGEQALDAGSQRRSKELVSWCRRRRNVRREDLLAFLAGRSNLPKYSYRSSPRHSSHRTGMEQRARPRLPASPIHNPPEPDLATFREALGIAGSGGTVARRFSGIHEINSFIDNEFNRNKRPAPTPSPPSAYNDVTMDSPQHKRFKYT